MLPAELSPQQFLSTYWQKKPLLLRQALPGFTDLLSPEELAGLACEDDAESRLIHHSGSTWNVRHGPFSEQDFTSLPDADWTLLVQAVDHWFPALKALLQELPFIPDWRLDDVMVSYATENAGVGPHFDQYDVFIVQGSGTRRWQLGQQCAADTPLTQNTELLILQQFSPEQEFVLERGDVLYIPPGLSHQGISIGESMSYSIGFRAPSMAEIISAFAGRLCSTLGEDQRYSDGDAPVRMHSAEITRDDLDRASQILLQSLRNDDLLCRSFGELMTQRKYPEQRYFPDAEIDMETMQSLLASGTFLERHPAARFAFSRQDNTLILFADGDSHSLPAELESLVLAICDNRNLVLSLPGEAPSAETLKLLCELYNQGSLLTDD